MLVDVTFMVCRIKFTTLSRPSLVRYLWWLRSSRIKSIPTLSCNLQAQIPTAEEILCFKTQHRSCVCILKLATIVPLRPLTWIIISPESVLAIACGLHLRLLGTTAAWRPARRLRSFNNDFPMHCLTKYYNNSQTPLAALKASKESIQAKERAAPFPEAWKWSLKPRKKRVPIFFDLKGFFSFDDLLMKSPYFLSKNSPMRCLTKSYNSSWDPVQHHSSYCISVLRPKKNVSTTDLNGMLFIKHCIFSKAIELHQLHVNQSNNNASPKNVMPPKAAIQAAPPPLTPIHQQLVFSQCLYNIPLFERL